MSNSVKTYHVEIQSTSDISKKIEEGVESIMGGKILDYEAKEILNKGREEGKLAGCRELALDMLRDNEPMEKIVKYSHLSIAEIQELSLQIG